MLGLGWFPATIGGLDRYYRSLFEQLGEAAGIIIGEAPDAPSRLQAVSRPDASLPARWLAYRRAARAASHEAEVVDMHFALYAFAVGRLRGLPRVFHFHGPWAQENVAAGDTSRVRLALRRVLERRVLHGADAHVVLSGAFRRELIERYRVAPWGVRVIGPGVELEAFAPGDRAQARAALGVAPGSFVAVCVRRLVARMGVDVLLEAWERLPSGSTLLVVGDGPLREALAARARGDVRFLGRISDEQLLHAYRAADVAVVPSLSHEGFGLVVLEAAACGTPSVVSDVGGLPEAIRGLDPSLVVRAGDAEALAARLRAAAEGALPARPAARAHAESFSWTAAAERHRALHRELVSDAIDERPRVVYVDHVARLSGGEIALLRLLPHLRGVNAHVILGEDGLFAQRLAQAGVSVEVLALAARTRDVRRASARLGAASPAALLGTVAYVVRLALRLRSLHAEIVHTNSLKAGVYGSLAAKLAGVPVVWHVRDRIAEDYLPRGAVRVVRALVTWLADAVVANSSATLDTLGAPRGGRPWEAIPDSVEPPSATLHARGRTGGPVDAGYAENAEHREDAGGAEDAENAERREGPGGAEDVEDTEDREDAGGTQDAENAEDREDAGGAQDAEDAEGSGVVFGMLGRIAPWKGQELFLRAFAAVFPDASGARAVIVGTPMFGEEDYEQTVHALAQELGIASRVEFRGFREDIWAELARFDVLVHASVIPEPFGQVVLEGMAAGLAVLAADEGGPAELVRDGDTGRLFASRDARALAAAMRELAGNVELRGQLGANALAALAAYHPAALAERYDSLYRRVLGGSGRR